MILLLYFSMKSYLFESSYIVQIYEQKYEDDEIYM